MESNDSGGRWTIDPYVGVGPLTFDLSRQDVRKSLNTEFQSFRRNSYSVGETDAFDKFGIFTSYDGNERLECVEAIGDTEVQFMGIAFLEKSVFDVLQEPAIRKLNYIYENGLYIFESGGFSLYVEGDTIKSVGVFRRGYYD